MATGRALDSLTTCPECRARVPDNPGHVPWCECGWNLGRQGCAATTSLLERLYLEMSQKRGAALFESTKAADAAPRRIDPARLVLGALSIAVLVSMPLLALLAVWVVAATWFNVLAFLTALFVLFCVWVFWPRPYRVPAEQVLDPESHPELMRLIGDVADRVGSPRPDLVAVNSEYDAHVARAGFRARRVLSLGLPLLATLDEREWVAVLGHELAHLAHGDERWGSLAGAGIQTVAGWCEVLTPQSFYEGGEADAASISAFALQLISFVPRSLLLLMVHLAWADSQRAEYTADRVAASVSGTEATTGLLVKGLSTYNPLQAAQIVVQGRTPRGILQELAHYARTLPAREHERLRRIADMEHPTLNATHPPEGLRIRMLQETTPLRGARLLDESRRAAIERELAPAAARVEAELAESYNNYVHGW